MPDEKTFGAKAHKALAKRGPLCVGVDPHAGLLRHWGLNDDVAGLERFSRTMVEAVAGTAAFVKPQSAFFERFGSKGIAVLEKVIADTRAAGALLLLDAKRGDIGSTMAAYADAYLDPASPLSVDAVTASPYLGFGSLTPLFDLAQAHNRGVFVLVLTSNPEGASVQRAKLKDGRTVAQSLVDDIAALNDDAEPLGSIGAVIGATIKGAPAETTGSFAAVREHTHGITHASPQSDSAHDLVKLNGPILVPGMGAQGGRPGDLKRVLGRAAAAAIPSYSREIARQGPSPAAIKEAVARTLEECRTALRR
ncbi:orotidine 5'-phosphate decarboxylase [Actinorhabdospora filicis]|uniref:Orotidine 5'-phosphate decarboxylase n=1 Tax=Actinorhabdospora filicis TaxID=1785913 RepID=A0A9W6SH09_9ACTN|nr:orotidine-5'-phosphate decarboxylase [Actinorhabdospora filicis]GLZ75271.1 orotidine 5'-phosphate decarboxylase [Actinorhabdospora filicis]